VISVVPSSRWHDDGPTSAGKLHSNHAVTMAAHFIADRRGPFCSGGFMMFTEAILPIRRLAGS
jgi:hypothetical protein